MLCAVDPLGVVIGVAAGLIVVGSLLFWIVRRVRGKGGCCGECSGDCSHCKQNCSKSSPADHK